MNSNKYYYCLSGHIHCPVWVIPCERGRCYIGDTSRPVEVRIKEHKHNLTQGLLEKKIKISPTFLCRESQSVLEGSEGLAD
jgi:hypothetical protein